MPLPHDKDRRDLDPEQLANLLRAVHSIYPDHDVVRCNATALNASAALCPDEVRFNITIRRRR